jgi:hypothetical protein
LMEVFALQMSRCPVCCCCAGHHHSSLHVWLASSQWLRTKRLCVLGKRSIAWLGVFWACQAHHVHDV